MIGISVIAVQNDRVIANNNAISRIEELGKVTASQLISGVEDVTLGAGITSGGGTKDAGVEGFLTTLRNIDRDLHTGDDGIQKLSKECIRERSRARVDGSTVAVLVTFPVKIHTHSTNVRQVQLVTCNMLFLECLNPSILLNHRHGGCESHQNTAGSIAVVRNAKTGDHRLRNIDLLGLLILHHVLTQHLLIAGAIVDEIHEQTHIAHTCAASKTIVLCIQTTRNNIERNANIGAHRARQVGIVESRRHHQSTVILDLGQIKVSQTLRFADLSDVCSNRVDHNRVNLFAVTRIPFSQEDF